MPTVVTLKCPSQSCKVSKPAVVVENVAVTERRAPCSLVVRTHATTESLWTSSPAQRSIIDSISYPPSDNDLTKVPSRSLTVTSLRFVLVATIQGTKGSRVMLFYGLGRTRQNRRHGRQAQLFSLIHGWPCG